MKHQLYIINCVDRPCHRTLAIKSRNGKFYYVHPSLAGVKAYRGMTPARPTPVEHFGISITERNGMIHGILDESLPAIAQYDDGKPRKWQGASEFLFKLRMK